MLPKETMNFISNLPERVPFELVETVDSVLLLVVLVSVARFGIWSSL